MLNSSKKATHKLQRSSKVSNNREKETPSISNNENTNFRKPIDNSSRAQPVNTLDKSHSRGALTPKVPCQVAAKELEQELQKKQFEFSKLRNAHTASMKKQEFQKTINDLKNQKELTSQVYQYQLETLQKTIASMEADYETLFKKLIEDHSQYVSALKQENELAQQDIKTLAMLKNKQPSRQRTTQCSYKDSIEEINPTAVSKQEQVKKTEILEKEISFLKQRLTAQKVQCQNVEEFAEQQVSKVIEYQLIKQNMEQEIRTLKSQNQRLKKSKQSQPSYASKKPQSSDQEEIFTKVKSLDEEQIQLLMTRPDKEIIQKCLKEMRNLERENQNYLCQIESLENSNSALRKQMLKNLDSSKGHKLLNDQLTELKIKLKRSQHRNKTLSIQCDDRSVGSIKSIRALRAKLPAKQHVPTFFSQVETVQPTKQLKNSFLQNFQEESQQELQCSPRAAPRLHHKNTTTFGEREEQRGISLANICHKMSSSSFLEPQKV